MKKSLTLSIFMLTSLLAVGCATTPNPEKICTADWIEKRADKAVSRIETRTQSSMKTLAKAAESWSRGKQPGLFEMMALNNSLKSLERELKSGTGIRDLKTLSNTCNDPALVNKAMNGFMRQQGLPSNLIDFIEDLDVYQDLLRQDGEV